MPDARVQQVRYNNPQIPEWRQILGGAAQGAAMGIAGRDERKRQQEEDFRAILPSLISMGMVEPAGENDPGAINVGGGQKVKMIKRPYDYKSELAQAEIANLNAETALGPKKASVSAYNDWLSANPAIQMGLMAGDPKAIAQAKEIQTEFNAMFGVAAKEETKTKYWVKKASEGPDKWTLSNQDPTMETGPEDADLVYYMGDVPPATNTDPGVKPIWTGGTKKNTGWAKVGEDVAPLAVAGGGMAALGALMKAGGKKVVADRLKAAAGGTAGWAAKQWGASRLPVGAGQATLAGLSQFAPWAAKGATKIIPPLSAAATGAFAGGAIGNTAASIRDATGVPMSLIDVLPNAGVAAMAHPWRYLSNPEYRQDPLRDLYNNVPRYTPQ